MEKIVDIIDAMAHEKNIPIESAVEAFEEALINTAKRCTSKTSYFETIVDMDRKDYKIEQVVTVLDDSDEEDLKRD